MAKPTDMPFGAPFPLLEISHDKHSFIPAWWKGSAISACELAEDKFTLLAQTKGGFFRFSIPRTNGWHSLSAISW